MLRVKNWEIFQHYKERRPIWIKLHRAILDDADYFSLSVPAMAYLPLLWLVAADKNGELPAPEKSAWRLRADESVIKDVYHELLLAGFLVSDAEQVASNLVQPASNLVQDASLEKRREETEREKNVDRDRQIHEIGYSYPGNSHLVGRELPYIQLSTIAEAVERDGYDVVLAGVRNYRDAVAEWPPGERRFVMKAERFFGTEAHYLKDPAEWRRMDKETTIRSEAKLGTRREDPPSDEELARGMGMTLAEAKASLARQLEEQTRRKGLN